MVKFTFELFFSVSEMKFVNIKNYMNDNVSSASEQKVPNIVTIKITRKVLSRLFFFFSSKARFTLPAHVNAIRMLISKVHK